MNILLVPIHLDALHLPVDKTVVEAIADFSILPYVDTEAKREINADVAHISEEILAQPFQNENLTLKAGIHLHWSLPDALTKGNVTEAGVDFPHVPNRWLITRTRGSETASWVVESDYCYPPDKGHYSGSVSYYYTQPDPTKVNKQADQPFTFVGRTLPYSRWRAETDKGPHRLPKLTALGYGEATFAAFYPNCHGIFGFYDEDYGQALSADLQYELLGWYSENDYLEAFLQTYDSDETKRKAILEELQWTVAGEPAFAVPTQLVCYARLNFNPAPRQDADNRPLTVAVGNTGAEALSAYLSTQLSAKHETRRKIEDQLESLYLSSRLQERQLDIGPKFKEARHDNGFNPISGGYRWSVRPETRYASTTAAPEADAQQGSGEIDLPSEIATTLSVLNDHQQTYDRTHHRIETLRQQLFSDWYKYILSAYPPVDANRGDDYPDIDEVMYYIREKDIRPLHHQIERAGVLAGWPFDQEGHLSFQNSRGNKVLKVFQDFQATTRQNSASGSLAAQLSGQMDNLLNQVEGYNQSLLLHLRIQDGTLQNMVGNGPAYESPAGPTGPEDKTHGPCLQLAGAAETITVSKINTHLATGRLTLSTWLKITPDPASAAQAMALLTLVVNNQMTLTLHATQDKRLAITWGEEEIPTSALIGHGSWHHFAITYDTVGASPQLTIFMDGRRQIEVSEHIVPLDSQARLTLGGTGSSAEMAAFRGQVTHIRLDNRILTPPELSRDMSNAPRLVQFLQQITAPRFWEPAEPVVLMTGAGIRASDRYGDDGRLRDDGRLACDILTLAQGVEQLVRANSLETLHQKIDAIEAALAGQESIGFRTWAAQPWHPFLLEWGVEHFPVQSQANTGVDSSGYASSLIQENYELTHKAVDLSHRPHKVTLAHRANLYLSSSIVTPYAGQQLQEKIETFLRKQGISEINPERIKPGTVDEIYETYRGTRPVPVDRFDDPVYTSLQTYAALHDEAGRPRHFLSQSLGGFNCELLMHKQTMQLPLEDPLGFDNYQSFTQEVAELVGDEITTAPEPLNHFSPIRSGAMKMAHLRLVDSFGQVMTVPCDQVITPERLTIAGSPYLIKLPPRLVQPARINFRWLAADQSLVEMNDNRSHTPICGWFLPNNLDSSLMVYDRGGRFLGSIRRRESQIAWQAAPGSHVDVAEIENKHLRALVNHILTKKAVDGPGGAKTPTNFLEDFVSTIDSALETIDPEGFAQHQGLALLVGRPLAIVRASVNLELQGQPAVNQSWTAFRKDLNRHSRETEKFTEVKFPIRIGEYQQLNDGLVGYWLERGEDRYQDDRFYAPQTPDSTRNQSIDHPDIRIHKDDEPVNLWQSLDDVPQVLTLLLDPRGAIHATSGILPTKAIDIPPDQYSPALQNIEVTFLTAPLLTDAGSRAMPLPVEEGFSWSWLEHRHRVDKQRFVEVLGQEEADKVWQHLLKAETGWLTTPNGTEQAKIVPRGRRPHQDGIESLGEGIARELGQSHTQLEETVERLFWRHLRAVPTLTKEVFLANYTKDDGAAVWSELQKPAVGWLKPLPDDPLRYELVAQNQRVVETLPAPFETESVAAALNIAALTLTEPSDETTFARQAAIREGWLVLRRNPE